jgi:hypothetical protein
LILGERRAGHYGVVGHDAIPRLIHDDGSVPKFHESIVADGH